MRKWNRFLATALAGAMVFSMAACGNKGSNAGTDAETKGNSTNTEAESKGSDTPTTGGTMTVLLSSEPSEGDALNMMMEKWADETGNKLDIQIIAYDDQLTKFPSMAKNNDLPDLIATTRLHQLYPEEFVDMRDRFDMDMFEGSALKIVGKDYVSDKITGLPIQFTSTCMYYNADAFEKAGLEVPTAENPWTWDEFV